MLVLYRTYCLLVLRKKAGAWRSNANACRDLEALKVYALPAEIMVVRRPAVMMEGRTGILRRVIAMTLRKRGKERRSECDDDRDLLGGGAGVCV